MSKVIDLTGMTFDRLTVLRRAPRPAYYAGTGAHWLCRCVCGKEKVVASAALRNYLTRSCGCLSREHKSRLMRAVAAQQRKGAEK